MNESDWRFLAQLLIEELDGLPIDEDARSRLREDLLAALARPEGSAKARIRGLLTGTQALRSWLDTKVDGDTLRSAGGPPAGAAADPTTQPNPATPANRANPANPPAAPEPDIEFGPPPRRSAPVV